MAEKQNRWSSRKRLCERMEKVRAKRICETEPLLTEPTETVSNLAPVPTVVDEIATISNEDAEEESTSERFSFESDNIVEDDDYDFTSHDAQEVLKEWIADQPSEASHFQGILLVEVLMRECGLSRSVASKLATKYTISSERSLRRWHSDFYKSSGNIVPEERGTWVRRVLIGDEKIRSKATKWLRKETAKWNSGLTVEKFKTWINSDLLPQMEGQQTNDVKSIGSVTAWKLMKELGFEHSKITKGFVDGHERADVTANRSQYITMMKDLEAAHKPPPTCSDGMHPYPIGDSEAPKSLVLIYHDESVFHSNDGRAYVWHEKGTAPLRPKDQGRGIMVTDFIDEHNGFLRLSECELEKRDHLGLNIPPIAREVLHVGEDHDGYFTSDKFCLQVAKAAQIAEFKYPSDKYTVIFVFDQAKVHTAYDDDALIAHKMNVHPGGRAPKMWSSSLFTINGRPQSMTLPDGRLKCLKMVLEERGVDTRGLTKDKLIEILQSHDDFRNEKNKVERLLNRFGHRAVFLPKFNTSNGSVLNQVSHLTLFKSTLESQGITCMHTMKERQVSKPMKLLSFTKPTEKYHIKKVMHRFCI